MKTVAIVPAYQAGASVARVVTGLLKLWPDQPGKAAVIVVDDGSTDDTAEQARAAGAHVVRHGENRGKGAALRTALMEALELGAEMAVSVDADAQHPPEEALRLALDPAPPDALVLGVRNLERDGAPRANRISNGISNFFLSLFSRRPLADTQCGLRRYPVRASLALDARADGYAYEAEIVLRAARAGWKISQVPVRVLYPDERISHFHVVRDPARIVARVVATLVSAPGPR